MMKPKSPQPEAPLTWKERIVALQNLPRFFRLVWQTSPRLMLANVVLRLIRSAIPVTVLYVGKLIIDQVVLLNQAGKNTHEHICESLELFAKEVMPEFQAAHPKLLQWKQQVLNREIDLEEIDTTAFKERYGGNMAKIDVAKLAATG